jgi:predicted TPR repeat methyltransferase
MHPFTPEQQAAQLRKPHGEGAEAIAAYMRELNRELYTHVVNHLLPAKNLSLLELGFGEGIVPEMLDQHNATLHYTGIDFSDEMVKMATAKHIPGARFVRGDIGHMPFSDQTFDVVFGINVLYFWETPEKELSETTSLETLLAKNGFEEISTETTDEPDRIISGKLKPMQHAVTLAKKPA